MANFDVQAAGDEAIFAPFPGATGSPKTGIPEGYVELRRITDAKTNRVIWAHKWRMSLTPTTGGVISAAPTRVKDGEIITVTAEASSGYQFEKWSDGDITNPRECTMTEHKTLSAVFKPSTSTHTLTIYEYGTEYGYSTPSQGVYTHNHGDTVTISFHTKAGGRFWFWTEYISGQTSYSSADLHLTITRDMILMIYFDTSATRYWVKATASPSNGGTVLVSGGTEGDVSISGDTNYTKSVTAKPASGYKFDNWSDGGEQTHNVSGDQTLTATFVPIPTGVHKVRYFLHRADTTGITLSSGELYEEVNDGELCALTPSPTLNGWTLAYWTKGIDGPRFDPATDPVTKDLNLYAAWSVAFEGLELKIPAAETEGVASDPIAVTMPKDTKVYGVFTAGDVQHLATPKDHAITLNVLIGTIAGGTKYTLTFGTVVSSQGGGSGVFSVYFGRTSSVLMEQTCNRMATAIYRLKDSEHSRCGAKWVTTLTTELRLS